MLLRLFPLLLLFLAASCKVALPLATPSATLVPATATSTAAPTDAPAADPLTAFELFLTQIENSSGNDRLNLVNRYMAQIGAPITSEEQAIFLWRGEAFDVQLLGDMNNWNLDEAPSLTRLEGTDLWYLPLELESDARLEYQFVIDGARHSLDPLNPRTVVGADGPHSELAMPGYETPQELLPAEQEIPAGTVTAHTIRSEHMNQVRTLFVYAPPGQVVGQKPPTLFFNDGGAYLNQIDTPQILDRLIALRQIPPLVAVFIPPIDPLAEYALNESYLRFLADEAVPFVRESYGTAPEPAMTGVIGSTASGGAALYAAFERPEVFGLAGGQSVAPLPDNSSLVRSLNEAGRRAANGERPDLSPRIALVVGSYETAVAGSGDVLAENRRLETNLEAQGYDFYYRERPEGNGWGLWQGSLGSLLGFLFRS